jgi:hypothetical protein
MVRVLRKKEMERKKSRDKLDFGQTQSEVKVTYPVKNSPFA